MPDGPALRDSFFDNKLSTQSDSGNHMKTLAVPMMRLAAAIAATPVAAALLFAAPASAATNVFTSASTYESESTRQGPFAHLFTESITTAAKGYDADIAYGSAPGMLTISSSIINSTVYGGVFQSGKDHSTTSSTTSLEHREAIDFPVGLLAINAKSARADVSEGGVATIAAGLHWNPFGNDTENLSHSSSRAGWAADWLVPATAAHAAGSAGRLLLTMTLTGTEFTYGQDDIVPPLKSTTAVAQVAGSTVALSADWTAGLQKKTKSAYIDFRYDESFAAHLVLDSSPWAKADLGWFFMGSDSFSAQITEVAIPLGTTLNRSFGAFTVANSSDPNLYPNAPVPEPSTWMMMFAGIAALGFSIRRHRTEA